MKYLLALTRLLSAPVGRKNPRVEVRLYPCIGQLDSPPLARLTAAMPACWPPERLRTITPRNNEPGAPAHISM